MHLLLLRQCHLHVTVQLNVSAASSCCHLSRCEPNIPRFRRSTFSTRAFSVAGPTVWNSLPDSLRDPAIESEQFTGNLKTHLFAKH